MVFYCGAGLFVPSVLFLATICYTIIVKQKVYIMCRVRHGKGGLEMKHRFENETINRLAKIEQQYADRCASCEGEDCICCEIYHDRQKWVSPEELFEQGDDVYYYEDEDDEDY